MPLPRLLHPVPVVVEQLSRADTIVDDDLREPIGDADRSREFTIPAQIKWFDAARERATTGGPEEKFDGYVLFRLTDLRSALINRIAQGDRIKKIGTGANAVDVDLYVQNLRYLGHYSDQRGPTLVRAYFVDRQPAKRSATADANLGSPSVWLSSEDGGLFAFLSSQLVQNANVAALLAFQLEGAPKGFDFSDSGWLWTLGGSGKAWIRGYRPESLKKSGTPVADISIATPLDAPKRAFFDSAAYSGLWCVDGDTGALALYGLGQLAASSAADVVAGTYVTLSIGASAGLSEPVDFATDAAGWGYLAHRRTGGSGGRKLWALAPAQLATTASGVVPTAQNAGSNFDGNPSGVVVSSGGVVWVSLFDTDQIAAFSAASVRAGGNPTPTILISSTALDGPAGLGFDSGGNLWVASRGNGRLLKFAAADLASSGAKTPTLSLALAAPVNPYYLKLA